MRKIEFTVGLTGLMFMCLLFTACQKAKEPEPRKEAPGQQTAKQAPTPPAADAKAEGQSHQLPVMSHPETSSTQEESSTATESKEDTSWETIPSQLTEKEQKEFGCVLEGDISLKRALKSLKILVKGDYKTIRCYKEYGGTEKQIRDRYETDICAAVKKVAYDKTLPLAQAKALNKPLPTLNLEDEIELTLKVIETKKASPKAVACAAEAIAWYQDKKTIPVLTELIKDKDPEVRLQAAGALLILGKADTALPVLDDLAKAGTHQSVFALEKLFAWEIKKEYGEKPVVSHSKLWDERGKDILIRALNYSSDEVKAYAAVSLAEKGYEKDAIEKVSISILNRNKWKESSDGRATHHAIYALEIIRSKKAIPSLKSIVNNPDAGYLSDRAAEALRNIEK